MLSYFSNRLSGRPSQPSAFHRKYSLEAKLGQGTYAQVYGARCTKNNSKTQDNAVKVISLSSEASTEVDQQLARKAHNEVEVWKMLGQSKHCVQFREAFFEAEICYIVMEKCCKSLCIYLQSAKELTERSLGHVFVAMLEGIGHMHSVGAVHRDIKPDNFVVGGADGNTVKLTDFGLSAVLPQDGGTVRGVCGTGTFMCPEMFSNKSCDQKADLWSFGVMAYVLLCGEFPYKPKDNRYAQVKRAVLNGRPPKFNHLWLSLAALECVQTLLSRCPTKRPTAIEALNLAYLDAVKRNCHMQLVDLPSLQPCLAQAKICGAINQVGQRQRQTSIDVVLKKCKEDAEKKSLLPEALSSAIHEPLDVCEDLLSEVSTSCPPSDSSARPASFPSPSSDAPRKLAPFFSL